MCRDARKYKFKITQMLTKVETFVKLKLRYNIRKIK
jgi:hypothetical protein